MTPATNLKQPVELDKSPEVKGRRAAKNKTSGPVYHHAIIIWAKRGR